ncbi:MAG: class I SAM-dependent methyltransferase [Planctomycetota bacterium]
MSAQDRTLDHYHHLMQINAASHFMRGARELGVFDELRKGQRTLEQLSEALEIPAHPLDLLLDGLIAVGIVEQYEDDYALSRTAHLLCQYDDDLGDHQWQKLVGRVNDTSPRDSHDDQLRHNQVAATQWIHTPAAMQAAEILDIAGEASETPYRVLDLGCGSAVWSCAMAHGNPTVSITCVDQPDALVAAQSTADSIELGDRFTAIAAAPEAAVLPSDEFDLVLIAQRLSALGDDPAMELLKRAIGACRLGGRVAVIDQFGGPAKPSLAETLEAWRLELTTQAGRVRSLEEIQQVLSDLGLRSVQFAFIEASKSNLGMAVGLK